MWETFWSAVVTSLAIVFIVSPTFRKEVETFFRFGSKKEVPAPGLPTLPDASPFDETQKDNTVRKNDFIKWI